MKKEIVGIFICMLLNATILPATVAHDGNAISSVRKIDLVPVIDFEEIQGGLFRIMIQ